MTAKPRRRFSAELKAEAVRSMQAGKPVGEVTEGQEIGTNVLYRWLRQAGQSAQSAIEDRRAAGEEDAASELR